MQAYALLLLSLLIVAPQLSAADHTQSLEEIKEVRVKVEILDLVHDDCKCYDRYVQSTLSLAALIEKEKLLSMQAEGGSLETNAREMVLDEHIYCGDDRPNLEDSIQKYANTVLYLEYGKTEVSVTVKIEDRASNRWLESDRVVAGSLLLKDFIKQEQELCMQSEGGDMKRLRATRLLELDSMHYNLNLNSSMRNFDSMELLLNYWGSTKKREVELP